MENQILGKERIFIIAEIGNNHNGSLERAIEMVDQCKEIGVDCVKFQMRDLAHTYRKRSLEKSGDDLGTEYVVDLLKRFELTIEEQKKLRDYSKSKNLIYLCTPWDLNSIDILESFKVEAYKVASADLTNLPLIDKLSSTKKPIILSTGMSTEEEVQETIKFLNNKKTKFGLLHCNSTYPAPIQDINLNWMKRLKDMHHIIGYSGHERGTAVTLGAVALGARIIERHFTLDRKMEGPDHPASLEKNDFRDLVIGIREIEEALGAEGPRQLSQGEMINRENLSKSLVASKDLLEGDKISDDDISVLSPGLGISPQKYKKLIGKKLKRDMKKEDFFFESDLRENAIEPADYNFLRPWGIPVRYHDFDLYDSKVEPDIFEFHLSYSDMDQDLSNYFDKPHESGFVVHAPELFAGSHLMDLTSFDTVYLKRSLEETQRVIDITNDLKEFFPSTKKPLIVANIGGFSMDKVMEENQKENHYLRFEESLSVLNLEGVEIIPQTMAPFPWHFGGQRFQNLFVHADEILDWCKKLNLRICFDVSHSFLTCNHFNLDFYKFAETVAPITAHLHLGDAKGVNGEGLQIGHGEIDFERLLDILEDGCPEASFIPEIWQGHKDSGEGFWIALNKLNQITNKA